jgi:hypothetical protein
LRRFEAIEFEIADSGFGWAHAVVDKNIPKITGTKSPFERMMTPEKKASPYIESKMR